MFESYLFTCIIPAHGSLGIGPLRMWFKRGKYPAMADSGPRYSGTSASDESLGPYYSLAEELDVPLGGYLGLGLPGAPYIGGLEQYRMSLSSPVLLENALDWALPRKGFHQYLRLIVEAGFGQKVMYGSGERQWTQSISVSVEGLLSAFFFS